VLGHPNGETTQAVYPAVEGKTRTVWAWLPTCRANDDLYNRQIYALFLNMSSWVPPWSIIPVPVLWRCPAYRRRNNSCVCISLFHPIHQNGRVQEARNRRRRGC